MFPITKCFPNYSHFSNQKLTWYLRNCPLGLLRVVFYWSDLNLEMNDLPLVISYSLLFCFEFRLAFCYRGSSKENSHRFQGRLRLGGMTLVRDFKGQNSTLQAQDWPRKLWTGVCVFLLCNGSRRLQSLWESGAARYKSIPIKWYFTPLFQIQLFTK